MKIVLSMISYIRLFQRITVFRRLISTYKKNVVNTNLSYIKKLLDIMLKYIKILDIAPSNH